MYKKISEHVKCSETCAAGSANENIFNRVPALHSNLTSFLITLQEAKSILIPQHAAHQEAEQEFLFETTSI